MPYYDWKKTITYIIIGIIIGFVGRGFIGGTFDDGWQAARDELRGDLDQGNANQDGLYELTGEVLNVGEEFLRVEVYQGVLDIRENIRREIKIDKETKLYLKQAKTIKDWMLKEDYDRMAEINEELSTGSRRDPEKVSDLEEELSYLENKAWSYRTERMDEIRDQLRSLSKDDPQVEALQKELKHLADDYFYIDMTKQNVKVGDRLIIRTDDPDNLDEKTFTAQEIEVRR